MKCSERWLSEWVNILDSKALYHQIAIAGLEVNNVKPVASTFNGVVIGEVINCDRHPSVDKLSVIKVNIGSKKLLNIVCSAPNCREGLKVVVATIGSVLPVYFKIKAIQIHGVLSEGMLCSFSELGILGYYKGIIELPIDAPIGIDIREYLNLDDNIIEISVTPNRGDCLSIIGITREIAALNNIQLDIPDIKPVAPVISDILPIQVEVFHACPRYLGRIVKDIDVNVDTPLWMKEKLRRCGINSVNVVIDITNYVLVELGQPIQAFDKDCIDGGIVVRMAKDEEILVLLNDSEVKFCTDTLVIADHKKVLAIGGILGGKNSCIKSKTNNLLLESAFFTPLVIKGSARRYGLHTEASYRYERGVDPELQYKAMERATSLLIDICHGKAGPVIDVSNKTMLPKQPPILLRRYKLDRLIGQYITDIQVSSILCRLGCKVAGTEGEWKIIVPSWRFDIEIEEDLIEEIARIYGYENIQVEPVPINLNLNNYSKTNSSLKRIKIMFNDRGYQEVITYSFVDPKLQQLIHPGESALIIPTPISSEMSVMRISLWSGLLSTIIYNQNRQQKRIRIFEAGLCFIPDIRASLGIRQNMMLAGAIYGNRYEEHWDLPKDTVDFYDMKGDLEAIFDLIGKLSEIEFRAQVIPALHLGQSAAIYLRDECIGFVGVVDPVLERKLNLDGCIVLFEIEWNKILDSVVHQVQEVPHFPATRRDIAVVVAEDVPAADVLAECKKVNVNQVIDVNLFDIYRGEGIAKGYKSLAISLIIQDRKHTLVEEEITNIVTRCLEVLKKNFQASLRD